MAAQQQGRTYKQRLIHEQQKLWLNKEVDSAQARGLYGTLVVVFEGGVMKRMDVKTTTLAPQ